VKYTATKMDSFTTMVEFTFDVTKPVEKSAIIVESWDDSRNSRKAILLEALQVDDKSMEKAKEEKMTEKKAQKKAPAKVEEKKDEKSEKSKEKSTKKPQIAKGKKKTKLKQQYQ
jgi:hypothetical protein